MQHNERLPLALVGGMILCQPHAEPLSDGVVVIDDGRIAGVGSRRTTPVPQSARVLQCSGSTITAGFWNSHVHFFERKWTNAAQIPKAELNAQLGEFLQFGFTSVFDLSSDLKNTQSLRSRIQTGEVFGPRILTTGEGLVPPGAVPDEAVRRMMGIMEVAMPEVTSADQVSQAVRAILHNGVDGVKLFVSGPPSAGGHTLTGDLMEPAVRAAREHNKPVFAHVNNSQDAVAALRSGVDVLAHTTPSSGAWDEQILSLARANRAALTPTLTLWKTYLRHDRSSMQERITDEALEQVRHWIAAGLEVLFGTDAGAVDVDPRPEYLLMTRAGMTFEQILTSLTTSPSARFANPERGRIAEGYIADLTVVYGDPRLDIRSLAEVRYTIRDGEIVYGNGIRDPKVSP